MKSLSFVERLSSDPSTIISYRCYLGISCLTSVILSFFIFKMGENDGIHPAELRIKGDICFLKIPDPNTEKCLINVILKKGKEIQQQRQKTPSMFLPLTLFWPNVHEVNNN